jgi:cobalt-zinc-cadmium efflux system outer membrane protein
MFALLLTLMLVDPPDTPLVPPQSSVPASESALAQEKKEPQAKPQPLTERLKVPPEIPGAQAPPILLPPPDRRTELEEAIKKHFPPLPPLEPEILPAPGPKGKPLDLALLQQIATDNNPLIRQAVATIEANRGAAIQAGLYPNPVVGYEADNVNSANTAGFQGAVVQQQIKTAGKLKWASAAATMDVLNAEVALRRAEIDLLTQVRSAYFAVLVAQENMKVSRALVRFTDEVFRIQVEQVKGAQAAGYEPLQLRVLAYQARAQYIQARNHYLASWQKLAATLSRPEMPPTQVAGRIDMPIPVVNYDVALTRMLNAHTDLLTARNAEQQARYSLRLAEVTPIPDVNLSVVIQRDYTTPPNNIAHNVQVTVPLPIWDRNQGNILQARANLTRAADEVERVRNDLVTRLADAYERYDNNRKLLDYYRQWILPDQVRAYRGVFDRYLRGEPTEKAVVTFGDVVTAQQTLAGSITAYVTALDATWSSVVDLAGLLQLSDLSQLGKLEAVAPVPSLDMLPSAPCR